MRRWRVLVVAALMVAACGSDPLSGVENCSDLAEAATEHLATLEGDDEAIGAFAEHLAEVATDMGQDALARGADTEALLCGEIAQSAEGVSVRQTFDEIESGLGGE